eukprot:scaffold1044_cov120-Isochrysis_galbana.AAC.15
MAACGDAGAGGPGQKQGGQDGACDSRSPQPLPLRLHDTWTTRPLRPSDTYLLPLLLPVVRRPCVLRAFCTPTTKLRAA